MASATVVKASCETLSSGAKYPTTTTLLVLLRSCSESAVAIEIVGRDCLVTYETMLWRSAHSRGRGNLKLTNSLRRFPGSFILLDIVKAPEKFDCWPSTKLKFFIHLCLFHAVDFRELNS